MKNDEQEKKFFEKLISIRKNNNLELHDISEKTKINIKYLKLIELGDFDALPNIYARLFIKAYADCLNIDHHNILLEYDKFTKTKPKRFIKIKPEIKSNILKKEDLKTENISSEKNDFGNNKIGTGTINKKHIQKTDTNQKYFYSPANIFKIFTGLFFVVIVYFLISYLSKEQAQNLLLNQVQESENIVNNNLLSITMDNSLLSNDNFNRDKLISKKNHKIKQRINIPYIFKIVTKEKTKLYVSHEDVDGNRIEDCNKIVSKDSLLKFNNNNSIYFDLWNAQHVEIQINNTPISKYLGENETLVRGSFEPINNNLYLEFYSY